MLQVAAKRIRPMAGTTESEVGFISVHVYYGDRRPLLWVLSGSLSTVHPYRLHTIYIFLDVCAFRCGVFRQKQLTPLTHFVRRRRRQRRRHRNGQRCAPFLMDYEPSRSRMRWRWRRCRRTIDVARRSGRVRCFCGSVRPGNTVRPFRFCVPNLPPLPPNTKALL